MGGSASGLCKYQVRFNADSKGGLVEEREEVLLVVDAALLQSGSGCGRATNLVPVILILSSEVSHKFVLVEVR
jgi:hypothetical protein